MQLRQQSIYAFMARWLMKRWVKFTFILQLLFLVFHNVNAIARRMQWTRNAHFTPQEVSRCFAVAVTMFISIDLCATG